MKKWTRALLALFLMATISLGSVLPAQAVYFKDVTRSDLGSELFDSINYVSDNGIIVGAYSDTYSPNASLTRAMVVAILYRWSGDGGSYSNPFTDVSRSDYYYNAVGWAYQNGIVYGTTSTQFSPGNPVTKEQFFAFLYRYANIYNSDKTDYASTSISGHPDYNQVEEYAKIPLRWAKGHHVLKLTPTESIYPKLAVSRKYAAAFITRYSMQIKGFDYSSRFFFTNSGSNFSSTYIMDSSIQSKLKNDITARFGNTAYTKQCNAVLSAVLNQPASGHCFGMSATIYLDKTGKIDFNRNTCGKNTMGEVSIPKSNKIVESVINYYQLAQSFPCRQENHYTEDENNLKLGAENIYNYIKENGPILFGFSWYTDQTQKISTGHRVIATACTKTTYSSNKTVYSLTYYDPNKARCITAPMEYSNNTLKFCDHNIIAIRYTTLEQLTFWNDFDFDSTYNTRNASTNTANESLLSSSSIPTTDQFGNTAILLSNSISFTVENAEGQQLHFNGQTFSGDIEVLSWSISETSPGEPYFLSFTVPYSDEFTYTPDVGDNSDFTVCASDYYGGIAGSGISYASIGKANGILMQGNNMQLSIYGSLQNNTCEYFKIVGTAKNTVHTLFSKENFADCGITGVGETYTEAGQDAAHESNRFNLSVGNAEIIDCAASGNE